MKHFSFRESHKQIYTGFTIKKELVYILALIEKHIENGIQLPVDAPFTLYHYIREGDKATLMMTNGWMLITRDFLIRSGEYITAPIDWTKGVIKIND